MHCAICGQLVQPGEASVATSEGRCVHIVCADREAAATWAWRRWWALLHALVVAGGIIAILLIGTKPWLIVLIGTSVVAHPLLHRRAWHYLLRGIRTWFRQR